jgi:hypothetical protein
MYRQLAVVALAAFASLGEARQARPLHRHPARGDYGYGGYNVTAPATVPSTTAAAAAQSVIYSTETVVPIPAPTGALGTSSPAPPSLYVPGTSTPATTAAATTAAPTTASPSVPIGTAVLSCDDSPPPAGYTTSVAATSAVLTYTVGTGSSATVITTTVLYTSTYTFLEVSLRAPCLRRLDV